MHRMIADSNGIVLERSSTGGRKQYRLHRNGLAFIHPEDKSFRIPYVPHKPLSARTLRTIGRTAADIWNKERGPGQVREQVLGNTLLLIFPPEAPLSRIAPWLGKGAYNCPAEEEVYVDFLERSGSGINTVTAILPLRDKSEPIYLGAKISRAEIAPRMWSHTEIIVVGFPRSLNLSPGFRSPYFPETTKMERSWYVPSSSTLKRWEDVTVREISATAEEAVKKVWEESAEQRRKEWAANE